jgi:hypothetical protein
MMPDAIVKIDRSRDWRGRFIRKLGTQPHGWLIWSKKWNCWHRRSMKGGACGYTSDIRSAGVFPRAKAAEYHDGYDNEAFHLSEKIGLIEMEIGRARAEIESLEVMLAFANREGQRQ